MRVVLLVLLLLVGCGGGGSEPEPVDVFSGDFSRVAMTPVDKFPATIEITFTARADEETGRQVMIGISGDTFAHQEIKIGKEEKTFSITMTFLQEPDSINPPAIAYLASVRRGADSQVLNVRVTITRPRT